MADDSDLVEQLFVDSGTALAEPALTPVLDFTMPVLVLRPMLERAVSVVPTRDVMPVLKHIKVEAFGAIAPALVDHIALTATDMELTLRLRTKQVYIATPGTAVVPAKRLLDIIKSVPLDADIRIFVIRTVMTVLVGPTRWTVQVPTGADFPEFPVLGDGVATTIRIARFRECIDDVRYAAAGTDRQALAAVRLGDGLASACDGARFAQTRLAIEMPEPVVLPIAAVDRILKLFPYVDYDDEMTFADMGRYLGVKVGTDLFLAAKPSLPYPDMSKAMLRPMMANRHDLVVDRNDLNAALRRVAVTADTDTQGIVWQIARGQLTIVARDQAGNETAHSLAAGWTGKPRTLALHLTHIRDLIGRRYDQHLTFKLGDDTKTRRSPILLTDEETGTVGVIPQMHLAWAA